jgi:hypothetical protein
LKLLSTRPPKTDEWVGSTGARAAAAALAGLAEDVAQTRPREARTTPGTDQSLLSGPSTLKQNRARFHKVVET